MYPCPHTRTVAYDARSHILNRIRSLIRYREFLWELVLVEFRIKYRRSALGFVWSLLNPLLTMLILAVVFQFMVRLPMRSYALFLLSALVPWLAFAATTQRAAACLLMAEPVIRRHPVPKLVFPISIALVNMINLSLSMVVLLLVVGPLIGFEPSLSLALLPYSLLCLAAATVGVAAAISVLTVYFRDAEHLISVLLTGWMYATPIIYPLKIPGQASIIPEQYHVYFEMNPMYHLIQLFTKPIYWGQLPEPDTIAIASLTAFGGLMLGVMVFWWREDDVIFSL